MSCGGVSETQPAREEIQELCEKVKDQVQSQVNSTFTVYSACSYTTQVVAGTNYFVKVKVGNDEYIHLRILRPLPPNDSNVELHSVQANKTSGDPIVFF